MKTKMLALIVGVVLVVIAVITGVVQYLHVMIGIDSIYGPIANRVYFIICLAISGIVGLFLAAWGLFKKDQKQTAPAEAAK